MIRGHSFLLDPADNGLLIAFAGPPLGALQRPAEAMAQDGPDMPGVMAHAGELGNDHRDLLQGPQVGVEPVGLGALEQGLLDAGQVGGRQLGIWAGGTPPPPGIYPALFEPGVPDVGALAGHAELAGDLGLGTALAEQLGRLEPSGLQGDALLARAGATSGRHRRTLTQHQPSRQPNPRNSNIDPFALG